MQLVTLNLPAPFSLTCPEGKYEPDDAGEDRGDASSLGQGASLPNSCRRSTSTLLDAFHIHATVRADGGWASPGHTAVMDGSELQLMHPGVSRTRVRQFQKSVIPVS